MKTKHENRLTLLGVSLAVFFLIVAAYHKLPFTFYQQDEWQALGNFLTGGFLGTFSLYSLTLFDILAGKGRFLVTPFHYVFYQFFPFQVAQAAVFALSLHFLNSMLLFVVFRKMFKGTFLAIVAIFFFTTASVASQSITWMAASTTTLLSAFFSFLSLFTYQLYLEKKKSKWMWTTLGLFIISFFIKESSIFFLLIYPFTYLLYFNRKVPLKLMVRDHALFIIYSIVLALSVLISIFSEKDPSGLVVTAAPDSKIRMVFHLLLYPFISFSQVFVGGEFIYKLADIFGSYGYSRIWNEPYSVIVRETIAADFVSFLLTVFGFILLYFVCKSDKRLKKAITWGAVFILLSFLPYAVLDKQTSYLESRYYYYAVVGGGVLFASISVFLCNQLVKYLNISAKTAKIICLLLVAIYITYQMFLTQTSLKRDIAFAEERKSFLSSLSSEFPHLEDRSLFYITGNTEYFLDANRTPFQQGIGYTLMVWYYRSGTIPKELISSNFLWVIGSEGYKEVGDKGFGVYSDIKKVEDVARKHKLSQKNIYSIYYDGGRKTLINTTQKTREVIQ